MSCTIDGRPDALIKAAARYTVVHLVSAEPDLEEIFLTYYSDEERHVIARVCVTTGGA